MLIITGFTLTTVVVVDCVGSLQRSIHLRLSLPIFLVKQQVTLSIPVELMIYYVWLDIAARLK